MALLEEVVRAAKDGLREALREHDLESRPVCPRCELTPPNAADAERRVIAALLEGSVGVSKFGEGFAESLYDPFLRGVFEGLVRLGVEPPKRPELEELAFTLRTMGHEGPVFEELANLRDGTPHCVRVREQVQLIRDAAARRKMSTFLKELEMRIRIGATSVSEAEKELREALP